MTLISMDLCVNITHKKDNDTWVKINTLSGRIFSQKTNEYTNYDFSDIDDTYQISKSGKYKNNKSIIYELPLKPINSIKKQFESYSNINFLYLLATAFVPNPRNYGSAELYNNGLQVFEFFEGFDAERDIHWVPNIHQKIEAQIQEDPNMYNIVYINEPIEIQSVKPDKQVVNPIISDYDSQRDGILEDTWTTIEEYPEYEIDKRGHVRKIKSGYLLKTNMGSTGYLIVSLNGKTKLVHRLVAKTFIPLSVDPTKTTVNHIDGNKLNNNIDNLEWASYQDQNLHMCRILHPDRPIEVMRQPLKALRSSSFEKILRYQLFAVNNILMGITIDKTNHIMYVNEYVYKPVLEFESTVDANEYFEQLGFPEANAISYNISINKDTYGYTWQYINNESINDTETWKIVSEIECPRYDLSHCTNYEVSSHGRFRKNGEKITDPSTFQLSKSAIHLGNKKELKPAYIIACAFVGKPPSTNEDYVMHIDGNNHNYHSNNLQWATLGMISKQGKERKK